MSDIKSLNQAIDENLKFLPQKHRITTEEEYYKLGFSPAFPPIEKFKPNQYIYASLYKTTVSVIGRYDDGTANIYQMALVLPRYIKDGQYKLEPYAEDVLSATLFSGGVFYTSQTGKIKIERGDHNTIKATFDYEIISEGKTFKVENGKLHLLATGPL